MSPHRLPFRLLALGALAVLAAGCHPAERRARQIAEKNAEARGGLSAWREVKTMSLAGHLEAGVPRDPVKLASRYVQARSRPAPGDRRAPRPQAEPAPAQALLPFVLELKRPHSTRLEVEFQGQTAVQVYDGTQGWKLRPFLGRHEVEPFTPEELRLSSEQGYLDGLLMDATDKGLKLELVGTEKVEGKDAFKIKITLADGKTRQVWVDTQSSLEVRVDGTRHLDGKDKVVYTYLRDYRPEAGLLVPHTLETVVDGVPGSEKILVEKVALNPELADARFMKPD